MGGDGQHDVVDSDDDGDHSLGRWGEGIWVRWMVVVWKKEIPDKFILAWAKGSGRGTLGCFGKYPAP